jgi:isopenicillin-N N-acyltransferase-like protein
MTDCGFPIIHFKNPSDFVKNGFHHGEQFRQQIHELFNIRKELLLEKNPSLKNHLKELALIQFEESKKFSSDLTNELSSIAKGSNLKTEDIVLLNNYTDFRDIILPDEGCSTVQTVNHKDSVSGQTWDMH